MDGIRIELHVDDREFIEEQLRADKSTLSEAERDELSHALAVNRLSSACVASSQLLANVHWSTIVRRAHMHISDMQPSVERSAELEARCKVLRREQVCNACDVHSIRTSQENREYRAMTRNIDPVGSARLGKAGKIKAEPSIASELRGVNRQLTVVVNTLLTVAGAFFFGYVGLEMLVPQLRGMSLSGRLIAGMVCASVVFFADLWFLFKSLLDEDDENKNENTSTDNNR